MLLASEFNGYITDNSIESGQLLVFIEAKWIGDARCEEASYLPVHGDGYHSVY